MSLKLYGSSGRWGALHAVASGRGRGGGQARLIVRELTCRATPHRVPDPSMSLPP